MESRERIESWQLIFPRSPESDNVTLPTNDAGLRWVIPPHIARWPIAFCRR